MNYDVGKCIIKINNKLKLISGIGFFCKIPSKNLKVLLTNNNILDKTFLDNEKKLIYFIDKNGKEIKKEINLEKKRYKYTNEELNFTVIEIIEEDEIIDFLEIDKMINSKDYLNEKIYLIQYPKGKKMKFSEGKIIGKKDNLFVYTLGIDNDFSGSPLLLIDKSNNVKVIGLNRCGTEKNNKKDNESIPLNLIINNILYIPNNSLSHYKYDYIFKLLIIGESGVGKKEFLLRFTDDSFIDNNLITIGIDFKIKVINIENKLIKLQIWDTAGQERFRTITKTYYKGSHGIILIYDVTDKNSLINIRNWNKQIEENASKDICKVLVGNKCEDPDRVVTEEEGKRLANEINAIFFETFVRTNKNVYEVFYSLTAEILKMNAGKTPSDNIILSKINKRENKNKKC